MPLILFGWPDMKGETTRYALEIPHAGSLILTHSWNGQVPALKDFAPKDRPDSPVIFWSFRAMVGLAFLMFFLGLWSAWLRWRGDIYRAPLFLRAAILMGPSGLLALVAGWVTTEVGRQPWVVYNVMRTADAVSNHSAVELSISLILFIVIYFAVFGTGVSYMLKLVAQGPDVRGPEAEPGKIQRPSRPLSGAPDAVRPLPGGEG